MTEFSAGSRIDFDRFGHLLRIHPTADAGIVAVGNGNRGEHAIARWSSSVSPNVEHVIEVGRIGSCQIKGVAFDALGERVVVGSNMANKGRVTVLDWPEMRVQRMIPLSFRMSAFALSPINEMFAVTGPIEQTYLYDLESGEEIGRAEAGEESFAIAFDVTGRLLATGWSVQSQCCISLMSVTNQGLEEIALLDRSPTHGIETGLSVSTQLQNASFGEIVENVLFSPLGDSLIVVESRPMSKRDSHGILSIYSVNKHEEQWAIRSDSLAVSDSTAPSLHFGVPSFSTDGLAVGVTVGKTLFELSTLTGEILNTLEMPWLGKMILPSNDNSHWLCCANEGIFSVPR
jgi:hypothetical protein